MKTRSDLIYLFTLVAGVYRNFNFNLSKVRSQAYGIKLVILGQSFWKLYFSQAGDFRSESMEAIL